MAPAASRIRPRGGMTAVIRSYNRGMSGQVAEIEALLRVTPVFQQLAPEDRRRVAEGSTVRKYVKGDVLFEQESTADAFYTIATGRVKIYKMLASGKEMILEVFGRGDPLGALATYTGRPFPASAVALEDTTCVLIPRTTFFKLLEDHPSLVRGLLMGMTVRLVELTNRLAELSGARIEPRLGRLLLKLGREMGKQDRGGLYIPLVLSRQELADMTGTTIETAIRIMSRWSKEDVVRTDKDGFVILDAPALENIAEE
jgi:CRP-like cAMP-binding protein